MSYMAAESYFEFIRDTYVLGKSKNYGIETIMSNVISNIPINTFSVDQKVLLSNFILKNLSYEDRKYLSYLLLTEQVSQQRVKLSYWSTITAQSSQIDTGYIAQHLVSLQTQIAGQGMRGKGDDLSDGSEVKSANFLDSLDKKGATAPRWNFTAVNPQIMERFLNYSSLYLLSMDLNEQNQFRTRIWKLNILEHEILRNRYIEWMNRLGYPKFKNNAQEGVNFQLFPPHIGTSENFARHGNGRSNGFDKLIVPLENCRGSELIFRADEIDGHIEITKF